MTTEERLREAARYLRTQHPRPVSCGCYIDELMERAADEMDARNRTFLELADAHAVEWAAARTRPVMRDDGGHEVEWAPGDIVSEPRAKVEWRVEGRVVSEAEFHAYAMRHPATTIGE